MSQTNNEPQKIKQLRKIVATCSAGKVEGQTVDLFSAGAIVQVYDALGEANKAKYIEFPVVKMASIAFKLAAKCKVGA